MKTYRELVDDAKTRVREVTVEDVMQMQARGDDVVVVDVREDGEWVAGHMPGAAHTWTRLPMRRRRRTGRPPRSGPGD